MKTLLLVSIVFALGLPAVPAVAGDICSSSQTPATSRALSKTLDNVSISGKMSATFSALSKIPDRERVNLSPLTNDQLASIEGRGCLICPIEVKIAVPIQINIAALANGVIQANGINLSQ